MSTLAERGARSRGAQGGRPWRLDPLLPPEEEASVNGGTQTRLCLSAPLYRSQFSRLLRNLVNVTISRGSKIRDRNTAEWTEVQSGPVS